MTRSTFSGLSSADLSASRQALSPRATYFVSPKRSSHTFERASPGVRQRSTNSSVAAARPMCSARRAPSSPSPDEEGGGAVPSGRFVAAAGQPGAHVGRDHEHRVRSGECDAKGAHGRTLCPAEVEGGHVVVEAQRGVDGGGIGLVDVGRRDGREPQRVGRLRRAAQGQPGRLEPHRGRVLVVRGDAARPLAAAGADERSDGRPVEPADGDIGAGGEDPSRHDGGIVFTVARPSCV